MDKVLEFLANNYIWIILISIFLIFSLIGYIAEHSKPKDDNKKKSKEENNQSQPQEQPKIEEQTIGELMKDNEKQVETLDISNKQQPVNKENSKINDTKELNK